MNWKEEYNKKIISADDAAKMVKSGYRMYWGLNHASCVEFDKAYSKYVNDNTDVYVATTLPMRTKPFESWTASEGIEHLTVNDAHFGSIARKMATDPRGCWFVPIQFREEPKYWEEIKPFDMVVITVGPMDEYGNFNFGPQVADHLGAIKSAKTVIVEVNSKMPYACGNETSLPISMVDYIIEAEPHELLVVPPVKATETEVRMAQHIVPLIESGSTLQLGIGGLPNTLGSLLAKSDITDLSVHSEMFVEAFVDLYNAGKITSNKNMDKGKMVYAFCGGTKQLYDFIDHNPACCAAPVDYVNSIDVIRQNDKATSINTCLAIDLFGQVSAESVGYKQISGTGGQLDFVIGTFLSKGGKSFLCVPSVHEYPDGRKESNIVTSFPEGTIVTTPRSCTMYVVTEYGVVNLKGLSTWERAKALISIAHPDFREELTEKAKKMGIWAR